MKTKNTMSFILSIIALIFGVNSRSFSQNNFIEHKIYPDGALDKFANPDSEKVSNYSKYQNEYGLNRIVANISEPTYTIHLAPKEISTGAAIVVFPGGGYLVSCIDREGYDVARWLNSIGISAMVVKYRTIPKALHNDRIKSDTVIRNFIFTDAREALKIIHQKSKEWGIDPSKIGTMGFSAGGHLAHSLCANTIAKSGDEPNNKIKPAFMSLIYTGLDTNFDATNYVNYPPTFMTMASDDKIVNTEENIKLYQFLRKGNISAEMHIFATGGHGFLESYPADVSNSWKNNFIGWLKGLGIIK
jgi:acetyl esterase/lipase